MSTSTVSTSPAASLSVASLFKNILHGSSLYSIATIAPRIASLILLPIVTRFLTPDDYGLMELLDQVAGVLGLFLGANFASALGYFYFQNDSPEGRGPVVGTTILGAALIGAVAGLICWPFAVPLSRLVFGGESAAFYLRITFVTMPVSFALESLFSWLRVEDRPGVYVGASLVRVVLTAATVVLLVAVFQLKVLGMLLSSLTVALISALGLATYCFRIYRPAFDARLFVRLAKFAAPMGVGGIALFVIHFGDRFFLRPFISMADLGLYALSYKIGMLVSAVYGSFTTYWNSQIYAIMRRDDADSVFARVHTYMVLGMSFVCIALIVASKPAIRLLAAPAFYNAVKLVPIIVTAYWVRSLGDFFRSRYYVAGRPGADAICNWLGAAICLAGYFFLIPHLGVWGAAIATVSAFAVVGVVSVIWTYRLRPYRLEAKRLLKIAAAIAACAIPYSLIPISSLPAQIAWGALLIAIFPGVLWILQFPTTGERDAGTRAMQRFLPNFRQ